MPIYCVREKANLSLDPKDKDQGICWRALIPALDRTKRRETVQICEAVWDECSPCWWNHLSNIPEV